MTSLPRPRTLHLIDLTALVVGYGLAAVLIRAFWPAGELHSATEAIVVGLVYLWLGLAMSGPVVLLLDRRARPQWHTPIRQRLREVAPAEPGRSAAAPSTGRSSTAAPEAGSRYTRAELAWLTIGAYWIGMTFLVIPTRLHDSALALVAVLQVLIALGLWLVAPAQPLARKSTGWTHVAAVGMLITWPLAWSAMILLCEIWL